MEGLGHKPLPAEGGIGRPGAGTQGLHLRTQVEPHTACLALLADPRMPQEGNPHAEAHRPHLVGSLASAAVLGEVTCLVQAPESCAEDLPAVASCRMEAAIGRLALGGVQGQGVLHTVVGSHLQPNAVGLQCSQAPGELQNSHLETADNLALQTLQDNFCYSLGIVR